MGGTLQTCHWNSLKLKTLSLAASMTLTKLFYVCAFVSLQVQHVWSWWTCPLWPAFMPLLHNHLEAAPNILKSYSDIASCSPHFLHPTGKRSNNQSWQVTLQKNPRHEYECNLQHVAVGRRNTANSSLQPWRRRWVQQLAWLLQNYFMFVLLYT